MNDNIGKSQLLLLATLLEAALHDTAAVLVGTDLYARLHASVEDELSKTLIVFAALLVRLFRVL